MMILTTLAGCGSSAMHEVVIDLRGSDDVDYTDVWLEVREGHDATGTDTDTRVCGAFDADHQLIGEAYGYFEVRLGTAPGEFSVECFRGAFISPYAAEVEASPLEMWTENCPDGRAQHCSRGVYVGADQAGT